LVVVVVVVIAIHQAQTAAQVAESIQAVHLELELLVKVMMAVLPHKPIQVLVAVVLAQ
jgi:hypothetical protein